MSLLSQLADLTVAPGEVLIDLPASVAAPLAVERVLPAIGNDVVVLAHLSPVACVGQALARSTRGADQRARPASGLRLSAAASHADGRRQMCVMTLVRRATHRNRNIKLSYFEVADRVQRTQQVRWRKFRLNDPIRELRRPDVIGSLATLRPSVDPRAWIAPGATRGRLGLDRPGLQRLVRRRAARRR